MLKFIKRMSQKAGMSPGSLVHVGEKKVDTVTIDLIDYSPDRFQEQSCSTVAECLQLIDSPEVTWINVNGVSQPEIIEALGNHFSIHPLVLEDIVHTGQRPKIEEFEGYVYIVLKMFSFDAALRDVRAEQVSFVLLPNTVLSFQEVRGDVFDPVRERIRKGRGRVRKMGADYLCYALLDAIVDNYFVILEAFGDQIERLEEDVLEKPTSETLQTIHKLRGELIFLRRSVWPLREVIGELERGESELITESSTVFFRDLYGHTIQVIETIETCRDVVSGLLDLYMSSISNRMNEVMKVLTIIATIFIPLGFIAGIYGMNFEFMPELKWHWGYPALWLVLVSIAGTMLALFKRNRWL